MGIAPPAQVPTAGAPEKAMAWSRLARRTGIVACGLCRRYRHILLEYSEVGRAQVGVGGDRRQAIRCRRQHLAAGSCGQGYALALEVGKEEQFVLDNRTTQSAAVAVAVKTRIGSQALKHESVVHRVQVAISEVFVQRSVKVVGTALDRGVELAAGRVAELGVELVRQQGEVLDRVVGDSDQVAGHRLVVVVHSFHGEVVVVRALSADRWSDSNSNRAGLGDSRAQQRQVQYTRAGPPATKCPNPARNARRSWIASAPTWCQCVAATPETSMVSLAAPEPA